MKVDTYKVTSGYDGKKCLVHARCSFNGNLGLATAQYLNVDGCDLFSGLLKSISRDGGKTWSKFEEEKGLCAIDDGERITVGCDGTPMYHKKTGKFILLGHTAEYKKGEMMPTGENRYTFYSVYDEKTNSFSKIKFVQMPQGFHCCGNGSGQSIELENGDLLIPVYYTLKGETNSQASVMRCSFDGEKISFVEMGSSHTIHVERGLHEPSIVCHKGIYYMTIRCDECGFVAKSTDGLHYTDMHLWRWEDGSLLQNYNTQQHWMTLEDELYLVYTRRGGNNDHVFRHRAPLFAARVENMKLVRDSEFVVVPERGARLGNFCVTSFDEKTCVVMAAEWMQPKGCEKYGSDNTVFVSFVSKE